MSHVCEWNKFHLPHYSEIVQSQNVVICFTCIHKNIAY